MFRIPSYFVRSRATVALQHRTSSLALLSTHPAAQRPQLHQRVSHVSGFSTPRSFHSVAPLEAESKRGEEKLKSDPSKIAAETKTFDDLTLPGAHPTAGVDGGGLAHDIVRPQSLPTLGLHSNTASKERSQGRFAAQPHAP